VVLETEQGLRLVRRGPSRTSCMVTISRQSISKHTVWRLEIFGTRESQRFTCHRMNSIEVCSTGLGRGWASRASMSSALESRHELLSPLRQNCAQPHSHPWPRHGAGSGFSPYWDPFTVSCVIPSAIDRLLITREFRCSGITPP
jgi:hypothetical protein